MSVIFLSLGILYYITKDYIAEGQYETVEEPLQQRDYEEEYAMGDEEGYASSSRSYNEPIVAITTYQMADQYQKNAVRLEAKFDGKLVRISGFPIEIESTDDGGASMKLVDYPFIDHTVFVSGGAKFKADAANIEDVYDELTLLCYLDGGYLGTPVLVDCTFDPAGMELIKREREIKRQEYRKEIEREEERRIEAAERDAAEAVDGTTTSVDVASETPAVDAADDVVVVEEPFADAADDVVVVEEPSQ